MGASLRRLDASYAAAFVPPIISFVGRIPDTITLFYQYFSQRYPAIGPNSFRAINSNTLSEVGMGVVLLGEKVEITLYVDRIMGQATNLNTQEEAQFTRDFLVLANVVARKISPETVLGQTTISFSAWLSIEGGMGKLQELLKSRAYPLSNELRKELFGAEAIEYLPRLNIINKGEGWRITVTAEQSVLPSAELFLQRNYVFEAGMKHNTIEQQLAFVDTSTSAIVDWFGIGPLG